MRRREFVSLLGAAAGWPLAARAQQQPRLPVIGWLGAGSPEAFALNVVAFRKGVKDAGFVEGTTVAIEYRWAENHPDRLPTLAAELAYRPVAVIFASGGAVPTRAATAVTSSIPIVFTGPRDPVELGLVASLNRPGGNVTGVNFFLAETSTKLLGLLHELVPAASNIGVLLNRDGPTFRIILQEQPVVERSLGVRLRVLGVNSEHEIDEAFERLAREPVGGLMVQSGPFLSSYFDKIVLQADRLALPTISGVRQFATSGGLMSYGASVLDAYHQAGLYVGRILKGEKPADLPVMQSTRFEFVINLRTAKQLGLTIPPGVLAIADEVIE